MQSHGILPDVNGGHNAAMISRITSSRTRRRENLHYATNTGDTIQINSYTNQGSQIQRAVNQSKEK